MAKKIVIEILDKVVVAKNDVHPSNRCFFFFKYLDQKFFECATVPKSWFYVRFMKKNINQGIISKLENIEVHNEIYLPPMLKKLSEIKTGRTVRINSFSNNDLFLKLMEMGCLPGENVVIEKVAPMGDPISIRVAGYSLSLRLNEAETILVDEE